MQEMMGTKVIASVTKVKLKILISVGCNQAANQNKCTTIACNISTLLSTLLWGMSTEGPPFKTTVADGVHLA